MKYLFVGLVLVVGCQSAPDDDQGYDDQGYIDAQRQRIKYILKDSGTVQFRALRVSRKSGVPFVCGEVGVASSPNGAPRFQRFISLTDIHQLESRMTTAEMDSAWVRLCG